MRKVLTEREHSSPVTQTTPFSTMLSSLEPSNDEGRRSFFLQPPSLGSMESDQFSRFGLPQKSLEIRCNIHVSWEVSAVQKHCFRLLQPSAVYKYWSPAVHTRVPMVLRQVSWSKKRFRRSWHLKVKKTEFRIGLNARSLASFPCKLIDVLCEGCHALRWTPILVKVFPCLLFPCVLMGCRVTVLADSC